MYDYRAIPLPGSTLHREEDSIAAWTFDPKKREMVSFDDDATGKWKAEWIVQEGLGGAMYWELSGDRGPPRDGMEGGPGKDQIPGRSLVNVVKEVLGKLDETPNWLKYEGSQFENLRNGME